MYLVGTGSGLDLDSQFAKQDWIRTQKNQSPNTSTIQSCPPIFKKIAARSSPDPAKIGFSADPVLIRADLLPSLHCTVVGSALYWEPHKSLKHDRECLTELLEHACFQPNAIQLIQLAEVDWESDDRDSSGKEVWLFVLSLVQPFLFLFDAKTTTVGQVTLFKLICSKNDGLINSFNNFACRLTTPS